MREKTSRTGRRVWRAASAAITEYFPAPFLLPKPPPEYGLRTRTRSRGIPRATATCRRTPKMCCVESHSVRLSPDHSATEPWVSMLWWSWSGVWAVSATATSARASACSTFPRS